MNLGGYKGPVIPVDTAPSGLLLGVRTTHYSIQTVENNMSLRRLLKALSLPAIGLTCLAFEAQAETPTPPLRVVEKSAIRSTVTSAELGLQSALNVRGGLLGVNRKVVSQELIDDSICVVSLRYTKGGFGLGGGGGGGLMSCRTPTGWSAPSFVRTGGFELGATIGFQTQFITIFITDQMVANRYMHQLNVDMKAYVNAVVANANAALVAAQQYGAAIIISGTSGLYAGVGLSFSTIGHATARNDKLYQNFGGLEVHEILSMDADQAPQITAPFNNVLRQRL